MTRTRRTRPGTFTVVALLALLPLAGCATVDDLVDDVTDSDARTSPSPAPPVAPPTALGPPSTAPTTDPDTPSGWGPTVGELLEATDLVSTYDDAQLSAAVLMPGFWGYDGRSPSAAEIAANQQMHGTDSAATALDRRAFGGVFLRPDEEIAALQEQIPATQDEQRRLDLTRSLHERRLALSLLLDKRRRR